MEISKLIATFFIGVLGSIIGAIVGSGGLISIPFLIFLGLPPQVAIATHKFGAAGLKIGAAIRFWKSGHIMWNHFIPFSILSFAAAFLGAKLLLTIDKELLSRVVAVLLFLLLPVIFLKKDVGIVHRVTSMVRQMSGYLFYFLAQVFGAFFGGGAASIVIYILITFFGLTFIEASATSMLPGLIMTITSLVIYGLYGILDVKFGVALFLGMLLGGWIGALVAVKKGNSWVKYLFAVIVVISAIKMLLLD